MPRSPGNSLVSGCNYFFEGARLVWHPALRPYLLVPLLVNLVLFVLLTWWLFQFWNGLSHDGLNDLSPWLKPIASVLLAILGVLVLILYGYSFNLITNILAAPFYGKLAEKAEHVLTGSAPAPEPLSRMIPRVMGRELQKLFYFITRGLLVFIIVVIMGFIPVINMLAPVVGLVWAMWCLSIQYVDYQADNHQWPFIRLRRQLWARGFSSLGLGGVVMGASMIPIINIFAMPAAVVAGTIFWLNELEDVQGLTDASNR